MLRISSVKIEGLSHGCITDAAPNISFSLESDRQGEALRSAIITVGDWKLHTTDQINNLYTGERRPFTRYTVQVEAIGSSGETAAAEAVFETGRLHTPWQAKWITDGGYDFPSKVSPLPMTFRKKLRLSQSVKRAFVNVTALGVYELSINGKKAGDEYFAPGLTSYAHQIQYQTYDVTELVSAGTEIIAVVAGAWASGGFNFIRKNKISADKQALLMELRVEYTDGTSAVFGTDESWQVTEEGNYRFADWYDGEVYDARVKLDEVAWKPACLTAPRGTPKLLANYGAPVRRMGELHPVASFQAKSGEWIYDFGQNFAGVIAADLQGSSGQAVTFRHAEVLVNGELFVKSLRTAKATAEYICVDGDQHYSPRLEYMGFRYVGVRGVKPEKLRLSAYVLHSDMEQTGDFECSHELLNRLQQNIVWGGRSNFVDIPTDCPQRDEKQGWTGDLAVFASTASFNFDTSRFYDKWLLDMRAEQGRGGGLPMVIPRAGDSWPILANSCWGDSCALVPWVEYLTRGNKELLKKQYPTIKKFIKAARWWSRLLSFTPDGSYIWRFPFHFGDWCAPDGSVNDWLKKGKWVATAYLFNTCGIASQIAALLGESEDAAYYTKLRARIGKAYRKVFTDGRGKLKKEFQTAYVLPLHFCMTEGAETQAMAAHLDRLVKEAGNHLTTGFTGTPFLLFALSDNGYLDTAYDLLLQDTCPSWLYEVKAGGTTIWERWDALREDGTVNIADLKTGDDENSNGGMVSFNHYANGAVGDWLYKRLAGIEPTAGGYKAFRIHPLPGGGIRYAKAHIDTPYGRITSHWEIVEDTFRLRCQVPVSAACTLTMPDGKTRTLESGSYNFSCSWDRLKG